MRESQDFWKKIPIGQNDQKWLKMAQKQGFGFFKKIMSIVLSAIGVKRKFLWFINILWKRHVWEKPCPQVTVENVSWLMRFQHSLIVSIFLIDHHLIFLDSYEWKEQGLFSGFLKKSWFWQVSHLWPKKWHQFIIVDPL